METDLIKQGNVQRKSKLVPQADFFRQLLTEFPSRGGGVG